MKKRFLAVILALALCVGLVPSAFASEMEWNGTSGRVILDVKRKDANLSEIVFSKDPLGVAEVRYPCSTDDHNLLWRSLRVVVVPDGTTISAPSYPKDEWAEGHIGTCVYYVTGPGYTEGPMFQGLMGHEWYEDTEIAGLAESADFVQFISVRVTAEHPAGQEGYRYYDELNLISESAAKFLAASGETLISPIIPMTIAKFSDLSPTGFYLDAVEWAVEKNITTGKTDTTFAPNENCTHGQILTFLWRAAGEPESEAQPPFAVKAGAYYEGAVKWAFEKGMIGKGFAPEADCTRADAMTYIWRAKGSPDAPKPPEGVVPAFTDVTAATHPADRLIAVSWAVCAGVTNGTGDGSTFSPAKTCTRGEIVTFLYRAYK